MSLQTRIVVFCCTLLIAVQVAAFLIVSESISKLAIKQAHDQLFAGRQAFQAMLEHHIELLSSAASATTKDFGFRRAVALGEQATIASVLDNHARRISADSMIVITPSGKVQVSYPPDQSNISHSSIDNLVKTAERDGQASSIAIIDGRPCISIIEPILAPDVIGWLVTGFIISRLNKTIWTFIGEMVITA
jgi:sensor histidine kinase regulating citrate/malate metabolism